MQKESFNPLEWINNSSQQTIQKEPNIGGDACITSKTTSSPSSEVEAIIQQIESKQIDITSAYSDWRNIGFAFADEFGENGRELFHRISRFYSDYSTQDCDRQFENCLKSNGQGISLKTFFFNAKQAGISISSPKKENEKEFEKAPNFPVSLYSQLPDFLIKVIQVLTSNEEKDIMLLGSLATLSSCLPKLYGLYDEKRVFANLYLFITAQASAGKGRLVHCKQLVKPIHKALREQAKWIKQQYEIELTDYNAKKGKEEGAEKPAKPQEKMLFIPANNSTTGVFQLLADNDGKGLIFETEGDTLAQAFKSDYGNYSDGFRKAYHHETISYYRRTDREYVDIESPCLSTVLSGTPRQIASLIPNAENGLFSRFIFYFMNVRPTWKNVFASSSENGLDEYYSNLGDEFFGLYQSLMANLEIQFCLSTAQEIQFNNFFEKVQTKYISLQGLDYIATVRRLGLIAFRIAMILSALRILETGDFPNQIICEDQDFKTTIAIIEILVQHASKVYSELPNDVIPTKRPNRKEKFLNQLPKNFNRQKYLEVANSLNIPDKTAEGYITDFFKNRLIHRESHDQYINLSIEET
jgi:hypothetical protein